MTTTNKKFKKLKSAEVYCNERNVLHCQYFGISHDRHMTSYGKTITGSFTPITVSSSVASLSRWVAMASSSYVRTRDSAAIHTLRMC